MSHPGPSAAVIVLSEDERAELVRRAGGPGGWPPDGVVRDMRYGGPPGHPVLRPAVPRRLQRPGQRVEDATGRLSVSETTARATAAAAGWSAARTVTMLMIWLAVCALTMLAALADAACPAATANPAGSAGSPPSLSTVTVTS